MDAIMTLRFKVKNLTEDSLAALKKIVVADALEDGEKIELKDVTDREAIIYATIEWLATGDHVGSEAYMEMYDDHGVTIYNRDEQHG